MTHVINDLHHEIVIHLDTDSSNTGNLYLRTYINGSTTAHLPSYVLTQDSTFVIPASDFSIGDEITKFEIVQSGSTPLWATHEGVVVLLNGEQIPTGKVTTSGGTDTLVKDEDGNMVTEDKLSNNKFYLNFQNDGEYDLQAVYLGNGGIQMAKTDKVHFKVSQPPQDDTGSLDNNGPYAINFVDAKTPAMTYNDGTKVYMRLTKGGVPVPNRTVQRVFPTGGNGTTQTNNKGLFFIENKNYNCGKFKIGGLFYDEERGKTIATKFRQITIKKGTPTFTDNYVGTNDTNFIIGSKYKAKLKYGGSPMSKVKVTLYVNGKATTKTTNSNGIIVYPFKAKGTYSLKLVYKGDKNHNKVEHTRKFTIVQ